MVVKSPSTKRTSKSPPHCEGLAKENLVTLSKSLTEGTRAFMRSASQGDGDTEEA